jgi:hypothetical protein
MSGCEVVREPTNRKNHSLKEENGREQQTNNSFFSFLFSFCSLQLSESHDARRHHHVTSRAVGSLPTAVVGLAVVRERAFCTHIHIFIHSVLLDNVNEITSTAFFSLSLCPYESTHMRKKKNEKSATIVTAAS